MRIRLTVRCASIRDQGVVDNRAQAGYMFPGGARDERVDIEISGVPGSADAAEGEDVSAYCSQILSEGIPPIADRRLEETDGSEVPAIEVDAN